MTRIILTAQQASQLQGATQPVELCDPSGRVLGRFTPAAPQRQSAVPFAAGQELDLCDHGTDSSSTGEMFTFLDGLDSGPGGNPLL